MSDASADGAIEPTRSGASIPTRIVAAFGLVIVLLAVLSAFTVQQQRRTQQTLRLLQDGYLPLVVIMAETKANHAVFTVALTRALEDRRGAMHAWVDAARRERPNTLRRLEHGVARAGRLARAAGGSARLDAIRDELHALDETYARASVHYDALFHALELGDESAVREATRTVREEERAILRHQTLAWRALQDTMAEATAEVAARQRVFAVSFGAAALTSLLVAIFAAVLSRRLLLPLPRLRERVEAVARGEEGEPLTPARDDELGALTRAFEGMLASLSEQREQLVEAERLAAIGRMGAHVTHEVRNPLSSIGLNVEMLADELPPENAEARELMQAIAHEVERLTLITEQYLRLARAPAPELEPVDLGALVRDTARFVDTEMRAAGVALEVHASEDDVTTSADPAQLKQVLMNLFRNAREAQLDGGRIDVRIAREASRMRVHVDDAGPGMAEDARARVFDLFYSTKTQGTGLGLSLSRQIALAHGGSLDCVARPEGGTRFTLTLPLAPVE